MLRLGIVDFDSSHSVELTRRINHVGVGSDQFVDGARVVLGVPGTSVMSPERIPLHAQAVARCGVQLVDSPQQLFGQVDAVLVLGVCGQSHLERARIFLEAGLPTYVDKPFACSWTDAMEMVNVAREREVLLWSSSALRFSEDVQSLNFDNSPWGQVEGVAAYGPAHRADGNPGLLHYGIHAAELLFALMGPDCEQVSCLHRPGVDLVTASFPDGRLATLRGARTGSTAYGFSAFCRNGVLHQPVSTRYAYRNLCRAIIESFQTNVPAVPLETTLNLLRFLLAAHESEQANGTPVRL